MGHARNRYHQEQRNRKKLEKVPLVTNASSQQTPPSEQSAPAEETQGFLKVEAQAPEAPKDSATQPQPTEARQGWLAWGASFFWGSRNTNLTAEPTATQTNSAKP